MASVFITGSSDGLGLMAANLLIGQGHQVVLHGETNTAPRTHARPLRAVRVRSGRPFHRSGAISVATQVNTFGRFDAMMYNAGIGYREPQRIEANFGAPSVFASMCSRHTY